MVYILLLLCCVVAVSIRKKCKLALEDVESKLIGNLTLPNTIAL